MLLVCAEFSHSVMEFFTDSTKKYNKPKGVQVKTPIASKTIVCIRPFSRFLKQMF
jgi:hypothetical protein